MAAARICYAERRTVSGKAREMMIIERSSRTFGVHLHLHRNENFIRQFICIGLERIVFVCF